jgi:flagellar M-ring protein FliF
MSKDPGFGVSQFMEGARYQHALETELAKTISSLQPVAAARVHLALPRQSAFVRDRRPPSASVLLQLKPGRRMEQEQVTAIVNLVASSIPELEANQVTVIDQQGRLLSSPEGANDEFAVRSKQLEMARDMEERYTHRIEELLTPLVGPGRVRAQVVADVELSTTEEAREQYRPESQVVRSEQTAEETSRNGSGPQGVPGALTNQPPTPGVALPPGVAATPAQAAAQPTATQPGQTPTTVQTPALPPPDNTSKQATRNYEIDRTVAYTKQPAGRLKRITVAVLIDNLRTTDADGKVVETELTPDQVTNITRLVKDAVGYNETRGDSVNVVNASFKGEQVAEELKPEPIPLWERPLVRDIAKLLAGLTVLLALVFVVLRPLVRGLLAAPRTVYAPPALPDAQASGLAAAQGGATTVMDYDGQITQARTLVNQDPGRVAQVVKTWVGKDE